VLMWTLMC